MKITIVFIAALLALISASPASAGDKGGNGGNSVLNPQGGRSLLDLMETDDVTFFDYQMGDYDRDLEAGYRIEVLGNFGDDWGARSALAKYPASFDDDFRNGEIKMDESFKFALAGCNGSKAGIKNFNGSFMENPNTKLAALRYAWVTEPLENIRDQGVIRYTNPQTKRQVALQKDGLVFINRSEFKIMDDTSKAALKLHEGTICAVKAMNPALLENQGTAPIRYFVREFTGYAKNHGRPEAVPAAAVKDAVESLLIKAPSASLILPKLSIDKNYVCTPSLYSIKTAKPNVYFLCQWRNDDGAIDQVPPGWDFEFQIDIGTAEEIRGRVAMGGVTSRHYQAATLGSQYVVKYNKQLLQAWQKFIQSKN
jgi:hypothetical protein